MTIEEIKKEMYRRGCKVTNVESLAASVIFDIISGEDTFYADIFEASKMIKRRDEEVSRKEQVLEQKQREYDSRVMRTNEEIAETNKRIDAIEEALRTCETAAGRDAMRRALTFKNSVSVDTKYDNTAFIIGLAAILSDGEFAPIEELQKINGKIPNVDRVRY